MRAFRKFLRFAIIIICVGFFALMVREGKLSPVWSNIQELFPGKKKPTNKYNNVAPIVVAVSTIIIPHHLPKTNPENIKSGIAKPSSSVHTIEKIKKTVVKNKKFSFLYFKIMSLFNLINS